MSFCLIRQLLFVQYPFFYVQQKFNLILLSYLDYLLAMPTLAPNAAIISAIPLPSPVPPPVTNAVLPANAPSGSSLVLRGGG